MGSRMCWSRRVGAVPADALSVAVERGGTITARIWMTLGNRLINPVLIIGSVRRERNDWVT